jgi:hypothetical protein
MGKVSLRAKALQFLDISNKNRIHSVEEERAPGTEWEAWRDAEDAEGKKRRKAFEHHRCQQMILENDNLHILSSTCKFF